MQRIIEKRTFESWRYDFDCSDMLSQTERIVAVLSVSCDDDVGLQFGAPAINTDIVDYSDGVRSDIGKVIQFQIAGGTIPPDSDSFGYGVPNILCTLRVRFATDNSPNEGEATVLLLLIDELVR